MKPASYAALCAALVMIPLAGCATDPAPTPGTGPISSGTGLAAEIVRGTQSACEYVPTAATIAGVLTAAPVGTTITAIVSAICAAVAPLASGPGMEGVKQGYAFGVRVHGKFVAQ